MRSRRWRSSALALALLSAGPGCALVRGPPKDGECRSNLVTILSAELTFHERAGRFSTHPAEVGFAPSRGNRYLYLFAREGDVTRRDDQPGPGPRESVGIGPDTRVRGVTADALLARFPTEVREGLGLAGDGASASITVGCAANLDDDPALDTWSISSADRPLVPGGIPFHHHDDRQE